MTVRELIEKLEHMPMSAQVLVRVTDIVDNATGCETLDVVGAEYRPLDSVILECE